MPKLAKAALQLANPGDIAVSSQKSLSGRTFGRGRGQIGSDEKTWRFVRHADADQLFLFYKLQIVVEVVEHANVACDVDENNGDEDEDDDDGHATLT